MTGAIMMCTSNHVRPQQYKLCMNKHCSRGDMIAMKVQTIQIIIINLAF